MNLFEICYHLKKQDEALKGSEIILAKIKCEEDALNRMTQTLSISNLILWDWFSWVFSDYISSILQ